MIFFIDHVIESKAISIDTRIWNNTFHPIQTPQIKAQISYCGLDKNNYHRFINLNDCSKVSGTIRKDQEVWPCQRKRVIVSGFEVSKGQVKNKGSLFTSCPWIWMLNYHLLLQHIISTCDAILPIMIIMK